LLEELQIVNWKGFGQRTFAFEPGLNLFVGHNGTGKTTVLEAIAVALTGAAVSADFKSLVRDSDKESRIDLTLRMNGSKYFVSRRFTVERIIGAELQINGSSDPSTKWTVVNARISEEMQTDPTFLSRIVYMSEGEIFEYLRNPPQMALNTAIRRVLGIEDLQTLKDHFQKRHKDFEKLVTSFRSDLGKSSLAMRPVAEDSKALREELDENKRASTRLEEERKKYGEQLRSIRRELESLQGMKAHVEAFEKACQSQNFPFDPRKPLLTHTTEIAKTLAAKSETLQRELEDLSTKKGALSNTIRYHEDILKLLLPLLDRPSKETVDCPVCKRPIDSQMGHRLSLEMADNLDRARQEAANAEREAQSTRNSLKNVGVTAQRMATLSGQIEQLVPPAFLGNAEFTYSDLESYSFELASSLEQANGHLQEIEKAILQVHLSNEELSNKLGAADAAKETANLRERLSHRLVEAYRGSILTSITADALDETIREQRDFGLVPLYRHIAELWQKCRPENKWDVGFDNEGRIVLKYDSKRLNFSQLSGGEKTVLLVIARVLICSMFSNLDFLTIDEPLEHLDTRNRRSIINFLVAATAKGLVPQAIVTTFEETLVRKYLEHEGVKTVYLSIPPR
jgi:DNA repair exonuclease SbcCD ATPase subunit